MEWSKVILRLNHDITHQHPYNQYHGHICTSHTLHFPRCTSDKILKVGVLTRSKLKSRSHCDTAQLHPQPMSTARTLQFLRCSPDKILKIRLTTARSTVESRSHHNSAHLHLIYLMVSQIRLRKDFFCHLSDCPTTQLEDMGKTIPHSL